MHIYPHPMNKANSAIMYQQSTESSFQQIPCAASGKWDTKCTTMTQRRNFLLVLGVFLFPFLFLRSLLSRQQQRELEYLQPNHECLGFHTPTAQKNKKFCFYLRWTERSSTEKELTVVKSLFASVGCQ